MHKILCIEKCADAQSVMVSLALLSQISTHSATAHPVDMMAFFKPICLQLSIPMHGAEKQHSISQSIFKIGWSMKDAGLNEPGTCYR